MKKYNPILHGTPERWDIDRKPHGGDSGGGSSTTVQNIPDELKPLATAYTSKAIDIGNQPYQPYTGQRNADLTVPQNLGLGMTMDRALSGSQTFNNAESNLNQMMQGGSNPYLDEMYNRAAGQTASGVNSQFALGGRYGSGAHTGVLADSLGGLASNMYGGAYENDQNRRMQAIGMAPEFANQAYQDAGQMMNAGQVLQDQDQNNLDFGYQQYQDYENLPYKQLAAMSGVFNSNLGGSTTQSSGGGGK